MARTGAEWPRSTRGAEGGVEPSRPARHYNGRSAGARLLVVCAVSLRSLHAVRVIVAQSPEARRENRVADECGSSRGARSAGGDHAARVRRSRGGDGGAGRRACRRRCSPAAAAPALPGRLVRWLGDDRLWLALPAKSGGLRESRLGLECRCRRTSERRRHSSSPCERDDTDGLGIRGRGRGGIVAASTISRHGCECGDTAAGTARPDLARSPGRIGMSGSALTRL